MIETLVNQCVLMIRIRDFPSDAKRALTDSSQNCTPDDQYESLQSVSVYQSC